MTKPVFSTGDIPSASQVNDWMVNLGYVRKTAIESVTSSTTFQNDDQLVLPVVANASYELSMFIRYDGASAADVKVQLVLPAGAFFRGALSRLHPAAAGTAEDSLASVTESVGDGLGALGAGTDCAALLIGLVIMGGTAGNCQLQWAQLASSATASRIWDNSYMKLVRVD